MTANAARSSYHAGEFPEKQHAIRCLKTIQQLDIPVSTRTSISIATDNPQPQTTQRQSRTFSTVC